MNNKRIPFALFSLFQITLGLAALTTACAPPSPADPDFVVAESTESAALTSVAGTAWTTPFIPVCFEPGSTPTAATVAIIRDEVAETWGRAANLSFPGWGTCTTRSRGLRINVLDVEPSTKLAKVGTQLDGLVNGVTLNTSFIQWNPGACRPLGNEACIRHYTARVFGAALGFLASSDSESVMVAVTSAATTLSALDVVGVQTVYGRKTSPSIVGIGGTCLDAYASTDVVGADVVANECTAAPTQRFSRVGLNYIAANGFAISAGMDQSGVPAYVTNTSFPHWGLKSTQIKALGDKCLDVAANGYIVINRCTTALSQTWSFLSTGDLKNNLNGLCVRPDSGNFLTFGPCDGNHNWFIKAGGTLVNAPTNGLCADVVANLTADGSYVQQHACNGGLNQEFYMHTALTSPAGDCLDVQGNVSTPDSVIQTYVCNDGRNQRFDIYP